MSYRYTINGIDVNPRGEWTISNEQNEGQIFFRRKLQGDLTFIGNDYDLIMSFSDCDVLEFIIYCGVDEFWTGQFKMPYDFDIDEDSCFCVGTPEVVDEYSCIMDHYDTEYDDVGFYSGVSNRIAVEIYDTGGALIDTLNTCAPLYDILDRLLNGSLGVPYLDCSLTIKSSFMFEDNFPNGTNYAGAYGTNNYITGAANILDYVYFRYNAGVRSDTGGTTCDFSQAKNVSFKFFENLLRERFNAYWYIDQNGEFRIEHIHFFDKDFPESDFETGINLKTLIANNKKSYAFRRNKYTYETGELYDQERWTWQHYEGTEGGFAHIDDFEGVPIYYGTAEDLKSYCVPGDFKEKDVATPKLWTDVEWLIGLLGLGTPNPDAVDCNGHLMINVDPGFAPARVRITAGAISAANRVNGSMSTANLQEDYFTWDRIFLTGDMNSGNVTTFDSEIRKKLQESIEFERCCSTEFDTLDYVETELGSGRVKAATEKQNSIEIELLY